jgi:hypothetical protein
MEGDIIYAMTQELQAQFGDIGCTILLRTDYKTDDMPTYKMPLILLDIEPSGDSLQCLGGLTMMDYTTILSVYNYQQGVPEDPTDYSITRINIADPVRQDFSAFAVFKSAAMIAALTTYGFKISFQGAGKAPPLEHPDGLIQGRSWHFAIIAFDNTTTGSKFVTPFNSVVNNTNDIDSTIL